MLKTAFIRDHKGRVRGQVVSGYSDGSQIVKNWHGQVVGRVLPQRGITKDARNQIISKNADPGFPVQLRLFHGE